MAHQQQKDFCLSVKEKLPEYFKDKWVLDIGSLDINGNNQYLFEQSGYIGIDLLPGRNVDFASKGHELQFPNWSFDVIVSTECFEHDPHYGETIKNIVRMLKPGGLFLFSCATTGRPEHGTRRTTPEDAPLTHEFGEWGDYYKNLEECDIRQVLDIDQTFSKYEFSKQHETHDLYFWGVKQGELVARNNYSFHMADSLNCKLGIRIKTLESAETRLTAIEAETRQRLKVVQAELAEAELKLNQQLLIFEKIINSNSWRITRPLRFFVRMIRG